MSVTYAGGVAAETADAAGVRARPAHRGLAAAAGLVGMLSGAAILMLHVLNGGLPFTGWWTGTATIGLASGALGWLVAHQAPANPIGWLMCAAGVGNGVCGAGREYLVWSLTRHPLPAAVWIGGFADSLFVISMAALPAVLMLFPDG